MMFIAAISLAFRSIRRNALRSFLTTIGIVIGVASVIAMVTLTRSAQQRVTDEISSLGDNLMMIIPDAGPRSQGVVRMRPFSLADARAIEQSVLGVSAVAPSVGVSAQLVYGSRNRSTSITGADNAWFRVRKWGIGSGREFEASEERSGTPVCVLGETVRRELFGEGIPLGERIRVNNVSCEVIGVLEARGQSTFGQDQDDLLVMPLIAVQRRLLGTTDIGVIAVSGRDGVSLADVQADIEQLLRARRRISVGEEDDFMVRDLREVTQMIATIGSALGALLGAIAAVSLLVGGIGIMNIMLVSVTERTREIGIRLAVGARSREILWQFLIEAVVLSALGGLFGIVLGISGSAVVARFMGLPLALGVDVIAGAFSFSALVGVFFGWYPARRAAYLDPIEALRHE